MKKLLMMFALVMAGFVSTARANEDAGLYDPAPPPGSVFVRFASNVNESGSKEVKANGKTYEHMSYGKVSSYYTMPKGKIDIKFADATTALTAEEGGFYTVVLKPDATIATFADKKNANMAKSQVILYNLGVKSDIALKTADGKVEVIGKTAENKSESREMNAVKVSLAVMSGDTKINELGEKQLERGRTYGVFVFDEKNVQWVASQTNTTR